MTRSVTVAIALVFFLASAADAEPPFSVPWDARPVRFDSRRDELVAVSTASPDERLDRLEARRASARRRADEACRAALHQFVDEALLAGHRFPTVAARLHRAVDTAASVRGLRPLADGSVVMVAIVPGAALRGAIPLEDVPWSP